MKKKIIWSVVGVLIIIVALMGILYYTTDLFKSPEQLFYRHLVNSTELLGKANYKDVIEEVEKQSKMSQEESGEVTAKITSTDTSTKELGKVLEKGKITYNMKNVGSENKMQGDFTLNYDGKDIVTLNLLKNQEQYGIKIAEAYDKYVSVENNDLKALFQKIGMDTTNIPDKIEMIDYYKFLNIDESTLRHIRTTYFDMIKENISAESYSVDKNVTVNIDGTDVTTNAYKLTLTEEQLKNILVKVFETLKTDDTTLNLIVDKCNTIINPYKTMGEVTELTKESLVEAIEEELNTLKNTTANNKPALEIVTYGEKDNKAKIAINALEDNASVAKIEFDMTKDNDNRKLSMKCSAEDTIINMTIIGNNEKVEMNILMTTEEANIEMNSIINADKPSEATMKVTSDGTTFEVNAKTEVKSTENITVEDFTAENSVKLNDMTEEEMSTLVQTIYTNVMKALPQKAQLLGINL